MHKLVSEMKKFESVGGPLVSKTDGYIQLLPRINFLNYYLTDNKWEGTPGVTSAKEELNALIDQAVADLQKKTEDLLLRKEN